MALSSRANVKEPGKMQDSCKKIVVVNQTPFDITVRITNMFRSFDNAIIKRGKEAEFPFHPQKLLMFEEYFWLKVWYQNCYVKLRAYGGKKGTLNFVYKVRKDGIYGKPLGSADHSALIKRWEQSDSRPTTSTISKTSFLAKTPSDKRSRTVTSNQA